MLGLHLSLPHATFIKTAQDGIPMCLRCVKYHSKHYCGRQTHDEISKSGANVSVMIIQVKSLGHLQRLMENS